METKWLKDFLALSAEGNFRVAAKARHVSQPAFSRRIQALEAWIGAPLFDRGSQPSHLTKAGQLFLPVAQKIVALTFSVKHDIQAQVKEDDNRIVFSTISTLAQAFIPRWLKYLSPFIESNQFVVRTDFETIDAYFEALEKNNVDFFICYEDADHRFYEDEPEFSSLILGTETLVAVVAPKKNGAPLWRLTDKPAGQIPCLHTLSSRSPSPVRLHMENKYSAHRFNSVYDSSIGLSLKEMAVEGFGLAWIPRALVVDDLAAGRLVRAAEPTDDIRVDIRIYRSLRHIEPRVDAFWGELLRQEQLRDTSA